jgi:hypothetical protein
MAKDAVSSNTKQGTMDLWRKLGVLALGGLAACSTAHAATPSKPVAPAPPPKDDGKPAQAHGQQGGDAHSAALEQLLVSPVAPAVDKQNSLRVPLPDAPHWTRVRFLTVKSLVGFRYGKEHHAIVAAFVTNVDDNEETGACNKSFEKWAMPWIEAFEVEVQHDPPSAFSWSPMPTAPTAPKKVAIVDVDPVHAKTATLIQRESYAAAWAAYPAWEKSCLVVGVAIPARDDATRATAVRDRFVKEVFPKITVTTTTEPKERY